MLLLLKVAILNLKNNKKILIKNQKNPKKKKILNLKTFLKV